MQQLAWAMMPQNDPQGLRLSIPRSEAEDDFSGVSEGGAGEQCFERGD
ncbi:MAG: hypothetical protein HC916_13650, partial [Coleofasciculaceae cyanobacterium SM2_1_6]|nr:hypothetical protein [Coleofasciculaceae cyanobacterium SM2_1_6]